jgi:hypothetical protein
MNFTVLIEKVQRLPADKQAEVLDFVEFLSGRCGPGQTAATAEWMEQEFAEFSLAQAMRGLEDEPTLYGEADIKESWR